MGNNKIKIKLIVMKLTTLMVALATVALADAIHLSEVKQDPQSLVECTAETSLEAAKKWKENLPDFYENGQGVINLSGDEAVHEIRNTPHKDDKADFTIAYHPQCPHCSVMVED